MNPAPWQLSPKTRFDNRAGLYARYRPAYPPAAIDAVLEHLGDPAGLVAADLGAGTGILSRLLADRGVWVDAVEPNAQMRQAAATHEQIQWIDASAESTNLESNSVDLVVAAQAWHWFEPGKASAEAARILKPGGRLVLMWYDDRPGCPVSARYRQAVAPGASETFGSHAAEQWAPKVSPPFIAESIQNPLVLEYEHRLDREGLVGRARSASYVPLTGPDADRLIQDMHRIQSEFSDESGLVTLGLVCVVYRFTAPGSSDQ